MSEYEPHHVLVTGGAGFIGAHFILYLFELMPEIKIINLDKLTYASNPENLSSLKNNKNYIFVHGDIIDANLVSQLLRQYEIDTIIHFAAESHVDRSIIAPQAFMTTNVLGTFTLLEAAKKYWQEEKKWSEQECRFHHISTDEVYGSLNFRDPPFTESTNYDPRSPYSASKAAADHLISAYYHTYHLPVTVSNCSNNYGPFQHQEKLIPTIIKSCMNWQPIPVYGNGKNIRDWLYVKDHCRGIHAILKRGKIGERYHLGGNHELENITLVYLICDYFDKNKKQQSSYLSLINFVTDRLGHDFRYAINYNKIKNELGWEPQETFQTGLKKTIDYYF